MLWQKLDKTNSKQEVTAPCSSLSVTNKNLWPSGAGDTLGQIHKRIVLLLQLPNLQMREEKKLAIHKAGAKCEMHTNCTQTALALPVAPVPFVCISIREYSKNLVQNWPLSMQIRIVANTTSFTKTSANCHRQVPQCYLDPCNKSAQFLSLTLSLSLSQWALNNNELILSDFMAKIYSQRGKQVGCELVLTFEIKTVLMELRIYPYVLPLLQTISHLNLESVCNSRPVRMWSRI